MIERARWVVAFALRAAADVIEDLADHIDPRPWAGGGALPEWSPPPAAVPVLVSPSEWLPPPFAADLVADAPPHLGPTPDRPED